MAIALADIRISYDDFYRCSPLQFKKVFDRWLNKTESDYRNLWETTRQICFSTLQPHLKRKISVSEFWHLPWDETKPKGNGLTIEEERKEFERIKKEYGV